MKSFRTGHIWLEKSKYLWFWGMLDLKNMVWLWLRVRLTPCHRQHFRFPMNDRSTKVFASVFYVLLPMSVQVSVSFYTYDDFCNSFAPSRETLLAHRFLHMDLGFWSKFHFRLNTRTRRQGSLAIREWVCHEWKCIALRLWSILSTFLETNLWGPRLGKNLCYKRKFQLHLACLVVGIAKHVPDLDKALN